MKDSRFFPQAFLMLRILPFVVQEECFALKGGTALNLFIRDMPRLSVDIDLTYLPLEPREESLKKIDQSLNRIAGAIKKAISPIHIQSQKDRISGRTFKLLVKNQFAQVKIEPNTIIRGTVFKTVTRELSKKAQDLFEISVSSNLLSFEDLYGGKICAALDRQHPRDLFDVKLLLENEGISDDLRKIFLVYLISHNRPIHELLDPQLLDLKPLFKTEFVGMAEQGVTCEELIHTRKTLITTLKKEFSQEERKFLLSVKEMAPDWELLGLKGIEKLPAVRWKLENLKKMKLKAHKEVLEKLKRALKL